jgi:thymidylate synthase ThyX
MHLLDVRWKKDAQLEAQKFCELLYIHFEKWSPAVADWYKENRAKKPSYRLSCSSRRPSGKHLRKRQLFKVKP